MSHITDDTDLASLFGIDLSGNAEATKPTNLICTKCNGRGKFIGYSGRVVGNCFACNGSGLARSAGVQLAADDCSKCVGSGQWAPGRPCFACNATGKLQTATEVDVSAIAKAFDAARANGIKRPKLRLGDFTFARAPDTGRNAGSLYVTAGADYLGRVTDGRFHSAMACTPAQRTAIVAVAAKPHDAAKAYGLKTGQCSCCGRELTNGESISLGIGPICATKFGFA
jgi:hypothetical protein